MLNAASAVFVPSDAVEISKPPVLLGVTPSVPTAVSVPLFGSDVLNSVPVAVSM